MNREEMTKYGPQDTVHLTSGSRWFDCVFDDCHFTADDNLQDCVVERCHFLGQAGSRFAITTAAAIQRFQKVNPGIGMVKDADRV